MPRIIPDDVKLPRGRGAWERFRELYWGGHSKIEATKIVWRENREARLARQRVEEFLRELEQT